MKPYKDEETGKELYGFSAVDMAEYNHRLEVHTRVLKQALVIGSIIFVIILIFALYVLYQIQRWDLFTKFLEVCA